MLTTNVLQRTFHIRFGGGSGTAFTIDIERRQYLVTARHIIESFCGGELEIYHDSEWKKINLELVGAGAGEVDIGGLTMNGKIATSLVLGF